MSRFADPSELVGVNYGRLTVVAFAGVSNKNSNWECLCACGVRVIVNRCNLRSGHTTSCGCAQIESRRTHGMTGTPEYMAYRSMLARCYNRKTSGYSNYGGRGIRVCARWRGSFELFLTDVGLRPSVKHSLERLDNNGGYEPGNVEWANKAAQCRNKRTNRWITAFGRTQCIKDWAIEFKLDLDTLRARLVRHSPEEALTWPKFRKKL